LAKSRISFIKAGRDPVGIILTGGAIIAS